jgi:hypothetical protein
MDYHTNGERLQPANRVLFGRQLGFHLKDNHLVSEMQIGLSPGKQCISAILHKLLVL